MLVDVNCVRCLDRGKKKKTKKEKKILAATIQHRNNPNHAIMISRNNLEENNQLIV